MEDRWDAGETGCGELIVRLSARVNALRPGETIEVVARDAGAPTDLPAWCRMTGNEIVSAEHPLYVIRRGAGS